MVGIIVSKHIVNINTLRPKRGSCVTGYDAAGSIGGTIGTIGADGENSGVCQTIDSFGGSKGDLLIAATQAVTG